MPMTGDQVEARQRQFEEQQRAKYIKEKEAAAKKNCMIGHAHLHADAPAEEPTGKPDLPVVNEPHADDGDADATT